MKTVISLFFILTSSSFIFGATFVVNNTGDTDDANPSDNLCLDANGNCTLRAAVQQANAQAENDLITFASNISLIPLNNEILITNNGSLTITGRGANLLNITKANETSRVFRTDSATLTMTDLTVSGGRIPSFTSASGSGMFVSGGAVTLDHVVFNDNRDLNGRQNPGFGGGVLFSGGTHVIRNSTFSNNRAAGGGGGIYNSGNLTISNSTFSGNSSLFNGGGLDNAGTGNLDLFNVTITNNTAFASCISQCNAFGGGISQYSSGALRIANSIIGGNTTVPRIQEVVGPEIYFSGNGSLISLGNNLIGDSAGDSTNTGSPVNYQPTDIRDIPPGLAVLGNYGGSTPTHALFSGSPAINAGNDANAPPLDQRGAARVGVSDIGSYEFNAQELFISGRIISNISGVGVSGVTVTLSGSSSVSVVTDSSGNYSFANLIAGGNYTVTPMRSGTTFSPASATFNNLSTSQNADFNVQCSYSISPLNASLGANGGSGTVSVMTGGSSCGWTATSNSSFITVTGGSSGTGNGTVTYSVAPNSGGVRTGTITIAGQTFTVTQAAFVPTLSVSNVSLFEGNSGTTPFVFTVSFNAATGQTVTVNYATVNGTATPPSDYQPTSGTLTFAPGETIKTVTVLVNGDTLIEPNELFTLNLSSATGALIGNPGNGTIKNDDPVPTSSTKFDYDGDGRADVSVFRPSNGAWYINQSTNGFIGVSFGASTDLIVPADYDGDGKTDVAVFRPSNGSWYYLKSSNGSFLGVQFGQNGDIPLPGDYDGDGKADISVVRPSTGSWYRLNSSTGSFYGIQFGASTDIPLRADFDGDGKNDVAVYRPSNGTFYWLQSSNGQFNGFVFPMNMLVPVVADYDGDGITDMALFRESDGMWIIRRSTAGFVSGVPFGQIGDIPVPADYNGDGKANLAVFRPSTNSWYIARPTGAPAQNFDTVAFGFGTDKPTPAAFQQ